MSEKGSPAPSRPNPWTVFGTIAACGASLFSEGYANYAVSAINPIFKTIYKDAMTAERLETLNAIAFAGTIIGMLTFGYFSDAVGRKSGMIIATMIILVFTALSAGSYYKGRDVGLIQMLTAWRFFLGIGIGAEYPTGSVAASEQTEMMPRWFQHGPFVLVTNLSIVMGSVAAAIVPVVLTKIFRRDSGAKGWDYANYGAIWRLTVGLGVVPCLIVLPFRLVLKQSKMFEKSAIKVQHIPYMLVLRKYWFRLTVLSIVWFIYDFIAYPFGLYSSFIVKQIAPEKEQLVKFGWDTVIKCFSIPGAVFGVFAVDLISPKKTFLLGLGLQIIFGYALSGAFGYFKDRMGAFCVMYGLFQSLGNFGPGDTLGLLASKSTATTIRGQFYGIAAAIGKVGAFGGSYAIDRLRNHWYDGENPTSDMYYQAPFYLGASLGVLSFFLALFFVVELPPDCQQREDEEFLRFLRDSGFNMSLVGMGCADAESCDEAKLALVVSHDDEKANAAAGDDRAMRAI